MTTVTHGGALESGVGLHPRVSRAQEQGSWAFTPPPPCHCRGLLLGTYSLALWLAGSGGRETLGRCWCWDRVPGTEEGGNGGH